MRDRLHHAEVLVVGAGPAGLAAACTAAAAERRVTVLDGAPWAGGQIWRPAVGQPVHAGAKPWLERLTAAGVDVRLRATVFAAPRPNELAAETPEGVHTFAWDKLVLATGARECFVPFPGWTLPGVLGPGGLHALAQAGWPVAGRRVVVAGTGPLLLAAAAGLRQHGARIQFVAEQAPWAQLARFGAIVLRHPAKLAQGLALGARLATTRYRAGCWPVAAHGNESVAGVDLTNGARRWRIDCDLLACGFHLVPNLELPRLLGCTIRQGAVVTNALQETSVPGVFCAGEPTGIGGAECATAEGEIAGLAAAGHLTAARAYFHRRARWHEFQAAMTRAFGLRPEIRTLATADTVVCRCEDVRRAQLEGCAQAREARLHTRCGMGACQGRICGTASEVLFGWADASVRPPLFPVRMADLADVASGSPRTVPNSNTETP